MSIKRILSIVFLAWLVASCEDVEQPMTRDLTEASFWKTEQDALDALSSCYENMFSADYFFSNDALSDNAYNKSDGFGGVSQIASGGYDGRTGRVSGEWGYHYGGIRRCNAVLENVDRVAGLAPELLARIKSEARFIRAHHHFQLATWYGDVPLVTKVLSLDEARNITRTARPEVIAFALQELEEVQASLPVSYDAGNRGRITRGAAIALRARVNLYESNWQAVVSDCEKLIGTTANGTFGLYSNYKDLFTVSAEYNNEIIFDLEYAGSRLYDVQRFFLPQTVGKLRSNLVPTRSLLDNYIMLNGKPISTTGSGYDEDSPYTNRDPRLEMTILHHNSTIVDFGGATQTILTLPGSNPATNTIEDQGASASGYYFKKYYDPSAVNYNSSINLILIRYADVLLMYAEAKNQLAQFDASVWDKTIKPLRQRAGFSDAAALNFDAGLSQDNFTDVIRRERRSELAFEGLHVFDIRRWKTAETVLNAPVKGIKVSSGQFTRDENGNIIVENRIFQPKHYLWPVPQYEIDQNNNLLPNNTGW